MSISNISFKFLFEKKKTVSDKSLTRKICFSVLYMRVVENSSCVLNAKKRAHLQTLHENIFQLFFPIKNKNKKFSTLHDGLRVIYINNKKLFIIAIIANAANKDLIIY